MNLIGKNIKRVDAEAKVTGKALYPGDLNMPGQAWMKILFAPSAHAEIKVIDTSEAENLPGILLVLTARDVPANEYGLIMPDQPVLCGPGSTKPYAERVRFIGDQVACVIAEDEATAARACKLIRLEYEELPLVEDFEAALSVDAPLLHPEKGTNLLNHYKIRHGKGEESFDEADVIVEGEYQTPAQEHAYLAPEAGLGYIDDEGRVTVAAAGQDAHEERHQIAHALGLPLEQVRVIHPTIGGAFGGREDISIQIVLALAAKKLADKGTPRPIKIIWNRSESIRGHHKRHRYLMRMKWGAKKDGKLVAARCEVFSDAGAYAYTSTKVQGNATLQVLGPYAFPNASVDSYTVYTNHLPGGAFRGFGGPQGAFAAEMQMNKLAEALEIDPVQIRLMNAADDETVMAFGAKLPPGVSIKETIRACAEESGWGKPKETQPDKENIVRRGIGFAAAYKNVGFSFGFQDKCWAKIQLEGKSEIEKVIVYHAGSDVGQGAHTVFAQMAAEAVGVSLDRVELRMADTVNTEWAGSSSASRMTYMAGNAIKGAGELALKKWQYEERPAVGELMYLSPETFAYEKDTGQTKNPNFSYGYVAETAEVDVDTETGRVTIRRIVCADDVGKAINPEQVVGQIEGCVVQAAGYTILENFIEADGQVKTDTLSTYLIPTVYDIPDVVDSVIVECPEENGPWGVRGMAEMPYLPLAPAVAAAVKDAIGVWIDEFPLTPERVLKALGKL